MSGRAGRSAKTGARVRQRDRPRHGAEDQIERDLFRRKPSAGIRRHSARMTQTSHFQQLVAAALAQQTPHRLLFVFAAVALPDAPTPEQRERHRLGRGGTLTPLMCVDKAPEDLAGFDVFAAEAATAGPPWGLVFAAALAGRDGYAPAKPDIDRALENMVEAVNTGAIQRFLAFDTAGDPVVFD